MYGCVLMVTALWGYRPFLGVHDVSLSDVTWPGVAALLVGATVVAATARPWGGRLPPRDRSAGAWAVATTALAGGGMVLVNLIQLALTGTVNDGDWATFAERLCLALLGALLVATALSQPRAHPAQVPGRVRWIAYGGCCALLPYLVLHTLGAAGEPDGFRPAWPMLPAGSLAVLLLMALVRPWGMAFPRWTWWLAGRRVPRLLPLTPVWLVAPALALYGTVSGILATVNADLLGLGGAASLAFGGYGWALSVAAVSYQIRTRPRCVPTRSDDMINSRLT